MTHPTDPAAEYEQLHGEPVVRRFWCWRRHRWVTVTVVVLGKGPRVEPAEVELLKDNGRRSEK